MQEKNPYKCVCGADGRLLSVTCPFCLEEMFVSADMNSDEVEDWHLSQCLLYAASLLSGVNCVSSGVGGGEDNHEY